MFAHLGREKRIANVVASVDEKTDKHPEKCESSSRGSEKKTA
jgi:hypothetical protein